MQRAAQLFFVVLLFFPLRLGFGQAVPVPERDYYASFDTVFRWSDLGLPDRNTPPTLSSPSLRRAFALGLLRHGPNEADYGQALLYETLKENLAELFFESAGGFFGVSFDDIKKKLRAFDIDLDSLEKSARGSTSDFFAVFESDTVSRAVLDTFLIRAFADPILFLPSLEGVRGDTAHARIRVLRNPAPLGAFGTSISSFSGFARLARATGLGGLTVVADTLNTFNETRFAIGGFKGGAGIAGSDISVADLAVIPDSAGATPVFQGAASIADSSGNAVLLAWPLKTVWNVYDPFDANRNFGIDIADAVLVANFILANTPPPIPGLGDANRNGRLDPDDPLIVFREALRLLGGGSRVAPKVAGGAGRTNGEIQVMKTPVQDGRMTVTVRFKGEIGSAERFACEVRFDSLSARATGAAFLEKAIPGISDSLFGAGRARFLLYPGRLAAGELAAVRFEGIEGDSLDLIVRPIGDNFFSDGETVTVTYLAPGAAGDQNQIPKAFELHQNYPNPFNPGTSITFVLPQDGFTELAVYNALGTRVRTLVGTFRRAGTYTVHFDGSSLPSGVYLYRLFVNGGPVAAAKKMVLLR